MCKFLKSKARQNKIQDLCGRDKKTGLEKKTKVASKKFKLQNRLTSVHYTSELIKKIQ